MTTPCKQNLSFVLADRWISVTKDKFSESVIIQKESGDFAIDDFEGFLQYVHDNVDRSLIKQLSEENAWRQRQGEGPMTPRETILLLEETTIRNRNGLVCFDPFNPVFTGYWMKKPRPGSDRKTARIQANLVGRGLTRPLVNYFNPSVR